MHIHLYKFKEDKPNIMCIIVLLKIVSSWLAYNVHALEYIIIHKAFSFRKQLLTECRVLEMIDIAVVTISFVVDVVFLIVAEGMSCATNYSKQVKHMIACMHKF